MRRIILVLSLLLAVFTFINALSSANEAKVLGTGPETTGPVQASN